MNPESTPSTPEVVIEAAHSALAREVAALVGTKNSRLNGTSSRHLLPETVSFRNLSALHDAAKRSGAPKQRDFLATSGKDLVWVSKMAASTECHPEPSSASKTKRKRTRDDAYDAQIASARERLASKTKAGCAMRAEALDTGERVLKAVAKDLRGPVGEIPLQSFALLVRRIRGEDRVVVAFRLNSGVPIAVSSLRRCLGECWVDGIVSTQSAVEGVCESELPLSSDAAVSLEYGNAPLLVVTSVPGPSPSPQQPQQPQQPQPAATVTA